MKKIILILAVALAAPTALLAQGRGGGPGGPPPGGPVGPPPHGRDGGPGPGDDPHRNPMFHALLQALDTNGDGIISMHEMNHAAESLLTLDKNGDGMLSHEEIVGPGHRDHKPKGDGPPPPPPGAKPDNGGKANNLNNNANPNAAGDKDDQKANGADQGDKPKPDGDKGGRKPRKGGDGDAENGNPPPPREDEQRTALVDAIDTNHDGAISAEEIANARANLKKLDLNHDGKLEPHEYGHPHPKP
jgi:hypothetical protein